MNALGIQGLASGGLRIPLKLHAKYSTSFYICIFLEREVFGFYLIFYGLVTAKRSLKEN